MADIVFNYKGKRIVIREEHPGAVVTVNDRAFKCHHHHEKDHVGLAAWMCEEAYFSAVSLKEMARHFADYAYLYDAPGRVRVDSNGVVIPPGGDSGHGGHGDHGGGH